MFEMSPGPFCPRAVETFDLEAASARTYSRCDITTAAATARKKACGSRSALTDIERPISLHSPARSLTVRKRPIRHESNMHAPLSFAMCGTGSNTRDTCVRYCEGSELRG
jgi:hypothetical protein